LLVLPPDAVVSRLRAAGCVFAEDEARILVSAASTPDELDAMVGRRVAGLPLEHVVGWAEFCGLRIAVDVDVFVPRRRTEFLVQQASALIGGNAIVVDMCCGSGALGAALASASDRLEVHAVDIDAAAVRCARRNLPHGMVYEGDLYDPLPHPLRGRVDVIVANAPYVPTDAVAFMPPEARVHEPLVALDGGADGLDVQRRVCAGALTWLTPGGYLLIETSDEQAEQTGAAFVDHGLHPVLATSADLDATVVIGSRARH
jgi:release factor glutamine methyltransferase